MSHIPFTIAAYLFNSVSVTVDKILLVRNIPDPLVYVFYFSVVSLFALLLLPFTHVPNTEALIYASASTLLWTVGAYCMFKALQKGNVSRVIPLIGTLIPIILSVSALISGSISETEVWAIAILIMGIFFLTFPDWRGNITKKEIIYTLVSAIFFALSYVLLRQAYIREDFLTVFTWSRMILIPLGLLLLMIPQTKRRILTKDGPKINFDKRAKILFGVGQLSAGAQELLLTFSVSLADPALVNSLQGIQYAFLFIFSLVLSKRFPRIFEENLSKRIIVGKILGIICIGIGLYILAFAQKDSMKHHFGVTYSPRYAQELGIDPKVTYLKMLDELKVKFIRFPVYWDLVEHSSGKFSFGEEDFYIQEAQKRGVEVTMVVGQKQPRWPECFVPKWAKKLSREDKEVHVLRMITQEVNHFKKFSAIKIWQVENEPLVDFGKCQKPDYRSYQFLKEEIALVKSLDSTRPIILTDSGELSLWYKTLSLAENFGTTVYRQVWNPFFGSTRYPIPPFFYKVKGQIVKLIISSPVKSFTISELQAEPWSPEAKPIQKVEVTKQLKLFTPKDLENNVKYAKEVGFSDIYLWGVEWWYWMKEKGHPQYVETSKKIFRY